MECKNHKKSKGKATPTLIFKIVAITIQITINSLGQTFTIYILIIIENCILRVYKKVDI